VSNFEDYGTFRQRLCLWESKPSVHSFHSPKAEIDGMMTPMGLCDRSLAGMITAGWNNSIAFMGFHLKPSRKIQESIMKRLTQLLLVLSTFATMGLTSAVAQESEDDGRKIIYKARTEIDFEGVDVAGELVKPQGALLLDRKKGSFNPLIRLREEFNVEMENSVNYIK